MQDKESTKNLILAIVVSAIILFGWQYFYANPKMEQQAKIAKLQNQNKDTLPQPKKDVLVNSDMQIVYESKEKILDISDRVKIDAPQVKGSIDLTGLKFDDITLKDYYQTVEKKENITVLSPEKTRDAYFAEFGYTSSGAKESFPNSTTKWAIEGNDTLTPKTPVTFVWKNKDGVEFRRIIGVDNHYMFTIKDSINNQSEKDIQLNPYARIKRNQLEAHTSQYIIHEGLFAWAENQLHEETYNDLAEDKEKQYTQKGGWFGVTDHYWMTNIIPPQNETVKARFIYTDGVVPSYQADYLLDTKTIKSGESTTIEQKLFSGAKSVELVDMYEKQGVTEFSYTIDWGWFFFFTKPIFYALNYIYKFVGNFGVAILCLTLLIKILFYPLANKSYRSMAQMKKLQPKLMELREKNKDDPLKQQQDLIALYKKEKVNPVSGCLPMIIQIPVFFALYKVLSVALEMRHAPFFGWIQDLSAKDPTNIFSLFGLIPFDIATVIPFLHIGIWPLLMGFTMWFQQRLNPSSPDPIQAQVMTWMPIIFTFLLGQFAAGLVIYWTWNNIISIAQQSIIMKQLGIPVNFNIFARKQVEQN